MRSKWEDEDTDGVAPMPGIERPLFESSPESDGAGDRRVGKDRGERH